MIVLDRLLVGGLRFVLDKIAAAAEAEEDDPAALREELLAAQMRHELGEIDEAEMAAVEADVLERLRRLRQEEATGAISFGAGQRDSVAVEISVSADDVDDDGR